MTYHDLLHGFRAGRGKCTTNLKAKLLHNLAAMRYEVLHMIFMDLHTAYDPLYRDICLEIL